MAKRKESNKLKIKIDFEGFRLDVVSDNPHKTLSELNKLIRSKRDLLEVLGPTEIFEIPEALTEQDLGFEFKTRLLTKELKSNNKSMDNIRDLILKHDNFLYRKERLNIKKEIDLNNKSLNVVIEKSDVNTLIKKIFF